MLGVAKLLRIPLAVLISALLSRAIGPEGIGKWSMIVAVAAFFQSVFVGTRLVRGVQPRLGVAWRPVPGSSLIVRAGYGIYRNQNVYQPIALLLAQQAPFSKSFTVATVAFYIMGAAVLNPQGLDPKGSQMIRVLSEMYIGPFGKWTQVVFIIGAGLTLFKTLYVSAASHSRLVTDFFRLNGFIEIPNITSRTRWVSRLQVFFPIFALSLFLCFKDPRMMVVKDPNDP
mgnify:CR=1 FL=1